MKLLLGELGFPISALMKLWCDNQGAIHIANNLVFHKRTKHIELDYHFIRDNVKEEVIASQHVRSEVQVVDIFRKALLAFCHQNLQSKLC